MAVLHLRCLGRLSVVTPFHHLSGDSHLHRSLGAGPITASRQSRALLAVRSGAARKVGGFCRCSRQRLYSGSCMQIAQIALLTEAIPPKLYGGTERVREATCAGTRADSDHMDA